MSSASISHRDVMDLYTFSLALGSVGLGAMAFGGLGHHSHAGGRSGALISGARHAHGPVRVGGRHHGGTARATHAHAHSGGRGSVQARAGDEVVRALSSLVSPRVLFSVAVGFGAAGLLLRGILSGTLLFSAAVIGGIGFERLMVGPLWRFLLRFASEPAVTLESCITDEARAVSGFDAAGQGLIAVELDGQVVQVLGTLRSGRRGGSERGERGEGRSAGGVEGGEVEDGIAAVRGCEGP